MNSWNSIKQHLARVASAASGEEIKPEDFSLPPQPEFGDLALGCFGLARAWKKPPQEAAKALVTKINSDELIESVSAAGPYLNFNLRTGEVVWRVIQAKEKKPTKVGTLMLEWAQPNTHKEIHVGHLRNLVLGVALVKILRANGWKVVATSYHGDVGAHVAKCLWMLVKKSKVKSQKSKVKVQAVLKSIPKDQQNSAFLGTLYTKATRLLDEQPELKIEVSLVQQKLEVKDPTWTKLWKATRQWSLREMKAIFKELEVTIDRQYLESEVVDRGQRMVDELLQKKVAEVSQGAVIVNLDKDPSTSLRTGLGAFLIRKSDGTSLYATKDLALAYLKKKEFPKVTRSLVLVDNRQMLYFRQLAATLKRLDFPLPPGFVGHEFVTLKTGAMSSRAGNIVTWQGFRDEVLKYALSETDKRHPDWDKKRKERAAWGIMMGGIKYGMLKHDSDKVLVFDMEQALSFDGATGPYIQYAATRLGSILIKAKGLKGKRAKGQKGEGAFLHPAEKRLALGIAMLPSALERAALELKPNYLAQWCLEMATKTNDFYRDVNVLGSPDKQRAARLRLVAAAKSALSAGLNFLGIPSPEEM